MSQYTLDLAACAKALQRAYKGGKSYQKLAKEIGVSVPTVWTIAQGKRVWCTSPVSYRLRRWMEWGATGSRGTRVSATRPAEQYGTT